MINFQYDQELEYQAIREEERAEGRQEGQKEGERQKAVEMAINLLMSDVSKEIIAAASGLTLAEIEDLAKKNNGEVVIAKTETI